MTFDEALSKIKNTSPLRITVSGDIGAGKSTFAKHLAEDLDLPRIYIGGLMREEAAKRNMTLDEFNTLLEQDDQVDRDMDALQHEKSKEILRGIFEGRTAWHFVHEPTVRVFLAANDEVAANRIWSDNNDMRDQYESKEQLMDANKQRKASEQKRYHDYYGIDAYDQNNFDVHIDTSDLDIDEVYEQAVISIAQVI